MACRGVAVPRGLEQAAGSEGPFVTYRFIAGLLYHATIDGVVRTVARPALDDATYRDARKYAGQLLYGGTISENVCYVATPVSE